MKEDLNTHRNMKMSLEEKIKYRNKERENQRFSSENISKGIRKIKKITGTITIITWCSEENYGNFRWKF